MGIPPVMPHVMLYAPPSILSTKYGEAHEISGIKALIFLHGWVWGGGMGGGGVGWGGVVGWVVWGWVGV